MASSLISAAKSGLLHVTEMSHSRIDKVEDVFQEGDTSKGEADWHR
jgi:ribosomal protein S1